MSTEHLFEPDIVQRVRDKFGADSDAILEQLVGFCRESPDSAGSRIVRCIIHAAHNPSGVTHNIRMAREDFRDIILTAEYQTRPGTKRWQGVDDQVYDFRFPFDDDRNSTPKNA